MSLVAAHHALLLAAILFAIGLGTLLARRNALFALLAVEIMLNAAALAFVAAGAIHGQPDGRVMFVFVLTAAAAEIAVGLALVLAIHRRFGAPDLDAPHELGEARRVRS